MKKYEDMLDLPHHESVRHPRMPLKDRAAQFSPFAALTGYEDAIEETGRITETKMILEEDRRIELDEMIGILRMRETKGEICVVRITYFVQDEKKSGGSYQKIEATLVRIDEFKRQAVLKNERVVSYINIEDIVQIELIN